MLVNLAIGLAFTVNGVPALLAQGSGVLDPCKSAGTTRIEAQGREAPQRAASNAGISLDLPIGSVCVGPETVDGAAVFVRRTTEGQGVTVVEVSTTPFVPVLAANQIGVLGRPDQPAGW
jgi:hypothetical protein